MSKKLNTIISALVILSTLLTACTSKPPTKTEAASTTTKKQLQIIHFWTAAGESDAAAAMLKVFKDQHSDVEVIENPVSGGGGVSQRVVLQARLNAGMPPDTFQTLGGAELKTYVDAKQLTPLDDLWKELNMSSKIPGPLANSVTIDGHPYAVPLNMHIQNLLYYNKKLFTDLKLSPPTGYNELVAACEMIKKVKPNMSCLALGSNEKWEDTFILDSILLELGGPEYYVKLYKGEIDVTTDATYKAALEKFFALSPYINANHAGLSWDASVGLVGSNQAAMVLMGTWAIGAFTKGSKWQAGVDFGAITFPQKPQRILLFHADAYGLTVGAPDPEVTLDWLRVVASPDLQIPTDVIQGGLFARTDIDPKEFPDPIRQELQSFVSKNPGNLILDQHGSIAPAAFTSEYWNTISNFLAGNTDINVTIQTIASLFTQHNVKTGAAWYQWP